MFSILFPFPYSLPIPRDLFRGPHQTRLMDLDFVKKNKLTKSETKVLTVIRKNEIRKKKDMCVKTKVIKVKTHLLFVSKNFWEYQLHSLNFVNDVQNALK